MRAVNKRKIDLEKEKSMYVICFTTLVICLISLLSLSGISPFSIFKGPITGAVILEENISFENITQEIALNAILQAEEDMKEMQEAGFGIVWVNDTLIETKKYFEGENYTALLEGIQKITNLERKRKAQELLTEAQKRIGVQVDYGQVLEKTKAISERKAKAYEIRDLIRANELIITEVEETGLNLAPALEILNKAKIEFEEERYDKAIGLLTQIEPKIDEIKTENTLLKTIYRAGRETTLYFIKEHYIAIIITLSVIITVFLLSYNRIMVRILNKKIKDMELEKEVLTDLMKKAQLERYSNKIITKQTYEIKMIKFKEKITEIKEQLPVLQARLDKIAKMRRII